MKYELERIKMMDMAPDASRVITHPSRGEATSDRWIPPTKKTVIKSFDKINFIYSRVQSTNNTDVS